MKQIDTIEELNNTQKYLNSDYKNSNYYREYLEMVFQSLKKQSYEK